MATMIETYDAQMLDYPTDVDVQMQPTTDGWFQNEDKMEDDEDIFTHENFTTDQDDIGIEIDMEPYVEDVEYEMTDADGEENQRPDSEILDVEVPDASQAHTPATGGNLEAAALLPISPLSQTFSSSSVDHSQFTHVHDPTESLTMGFEESPQSLPHLSQVQLGEEMRMSDESHQMLHHDSDAPSHTLHSDMHETSHPTHAFTESSEKPLMTHSLHDHPPDPTPVEHQGHLAEESGDDGTAFVGDQTTSAVDIVTAEQPLQQDTVEGTSLGNVEPLTMEHADTQRQDVAASDAFAGSTEAAVGAEHSDHSDEPHVVSTSDEDSADATRESHHVAAEELSESYQEEHDSLVQDPHEISEGVYIDPPPAVLLSLPSPDATDVCLFNAPVRSGSATPSAEASGSQAQTHTILLHDYPTLYYEPLSTVFEALRQEGHIYNSVDLNGSELVLDAYDLQLVVPEDNIYAREVSLHDLNVLHDGSDFSGPLRIRLTSVTPRFILRYHLLQDQIARLNLISDTGQEDIAADGGETYSEDQAEEPASELSEKTGQEDAYEHSEEKAEGTPQPEETITEEHRQEDEAGNPSDADGHLPDITDLPDLPEEPEATANENDDRTDSHVPAQESIVESAIEPESEHLVSADQATGEPYAEYEELALNQEDEDAYPPLPEEDLDDADDDTVDDGDVQGSETILDVPAGYDYVESVAPSAVESESHHNDSDNTGNENDKPLNQDNIEETSKSDTYDSTLDTLGSNTEDNNESLADPESDLTLLPAPEDLADLEDTALDSSATSKHMAESDETFLHPQHEAYEEEWDDSLDADGDPDTTWEVEQETETASNESSVTLSSKASKRSFHEADLEEDAEELVLQDGSPGSKRLRVE